MTNKFWCLTQICVSQVEIIANDQGNRTTPSYVGFTDTERLIGDAAKNQVGWQQNDNKCQGQKLGFSGMIDTGKFVATDKHFEIDV